MRKIFVFVFFATLVAIFSADYAFAAAARTSRGAPAASAPVATSTATRGRAPAAAAAPVRAAATTARSGVAALPARSAPAAAPVVVARAAVAPKVINNNTAIKPSASLDGVVDPVCQQRFEGCMDSFCKLENDNGGRCQCSDRKADLDVAWAEIQNLNMQIARLETEGLERIELGENVDYIFDAALAAQKAVESSALDIGVNLDNATGSSRRNARRIDLTALESSIFDFEFEDPFAQSSGPGAYDISGKTGASLYSTVNNICVEQMVGCEKDLRMLQTLYATNIQSDCRAYENDLSNRKRAAEVSLLAAQADMRNAALDVYEKTNKWDLGQCTVQFRTCMASTGGCGSDFTGCVGYNAAQNSISGVNTTTNSRNALRNTNNAFMTRIPNTSIDISNTTFEVLESKRPLCENVLQSCTNVKDQVWAAFLREVAPTIKTAEISAETKLRTSCISNISSCFQTACRDTIDPNDPDGSYDMCLTRPETLGSVCKTVVDPCEAVSPNIMEFVRERLAGMRVDSCTKQIKECLTSEDRCGEDYTQCIGLDTDSIIKMCPYDKLVGCQQVYGATNITGDTVYEDIARMVSGLMNAIDLNIYEECKSAADEAMVRICGDTESCDNYSINESLGTGLLKYEVCEVVQATRNEVMTTYRSRDNLSLYTRLLPPIKIEKITQIANDNAGEYINCKPSMAQVSDSELRSGKVFQVRIKNVIPWDIVSLDDNLKLQWSETFYPESNEDLRTAQTAAAKDEIVAVQKAIDNAIGQLANDTKVNFCTSGRTFQGMNNTTLGRRNDGNNTDAGRYPHLIDTQKTMIANAILRAVQLNYDDKYMELESKVMKDQVELGTRLAAIEIEKQEALTTAAEKQAQTEAESLEYARQTCLLKVGDVGDSSKISGAKTVSDTWKRQQTIDVSFDKASRVCKVCTTTIDCDKRQFLSNKCKLYKDPYTNCQDTRL